MLVQCAPWSSSYNSKCRLERISEFHAHFAADIGMQWQWETKAWRMGECCGVTPKWRYNGEHSEITQGIRSVADSGCWVIDSRKKETTKLNTAESLMANHFIYISYFAPSFQHRQGVLNSSECQSFPKVPRAAMRVTCYWELGWSSARVPPASRRISEIARSPEITPHSDWKYHSDP